MLKTQIYKFWTYIKQRRGDSNDISAFNSNNQVMTDLKDMADALNCQFQSVFSPIDSTALSANKSVIEMEDLTKIGF